MLKSYLNLENIFNRLSYSHTVKTGNIIFVAGQVTVDIHQ